jgi:hypothetical protein
MFFKNQKMMAKKVGYVEEESQLEEIKQVQCNVFVLLVYLVNTASILVIVLLS